MRSQRGQVTEDWVKRQQKREKNVIIAKMMTIEEGRGEGEKKKE